jgi:hypothetical protein
VWSCSFGENALQIADGITGHRRRGRRHLVGDLSSLKCLMSRLMFGRSAVFASLLLAASLATGCGNKHPSRSTYVQANKDILRKLPRLPGSQIVLENSSPRAGGEEGQIVGYVTRVDLRLPANTPAARISRFYQQRLRPRWRLAERLSGPVLNFRRGMALVSINLENARLHVVEIAVDNAFYSNQQ